VAGPASVLAGTLASNLLTPPSQTETTTEGDLEENTSTNASGANDPTTPSGQFSQQVKSFTGPWFKTPIQLG
jgi:hypothetical protein